MRSVRSSSYRQATRLLELVGTKVEIFECGALGGPMGVAMSRHGAAPR